VWRQSAALRPRDVLLRLELLHNLKELVVDGLVVLETLLDLRD
jgi:hypothetical protein